MVTYEQIKEQAERSLKVKQYVDWSIVGPEFAGIVIELCDIIIKQGEGIDRLAEKIDKWKEADEAVAKIIRGE
jgi:hypothetical protein